MTALLHGVCLLIDLAIMSSRDKPMSLSPKKTVVGCVPLAGLIIIDRLLSFLALQSIPVSLSYTVKSLAPLFAVALQYRLTSVPVSWAKVATLVPICLGVALATVSELEFEALGCVYALGAAFFGVTQTFYAKALYSDEKHAYSLAHLSALEIHAYVSLCCVAILAPVAWVVEGVQVPGAAALPWVAGSILFLGARALLSVMILRGFSVVSTQVLTCSSKLLIICVSTAVLQHHLLPRTGLLGVVMATAGVFAYSTLEDEVPALGYSPLDTTASISLQDLSEGDFL